MKTTTRIFDKGIYVFSDNKTNMGFCFDTNTLSLYRLSGNNINSILSIIQNRNNKQIINPAYTAKPSYCDTLTFILTNQCNMKCTYCYYGDSFITSKGKISLETVKNYFELFDTYFPDGIKTIHFFGGEPLLETHIIESSVKLIENICHSNNRKSPGFCINSNGLLLSEQVVDFFYEHNINLTISLDGKSSNNVCRLKKDGTETFFDVVNAVERAKKKYPDYPINVETTYTSKNVLDFHETGKHDIEVLQEVGFSSVHLIPVLLDESDSLNPLGSEQIRNLTFDYISYAYDYMFASFGTDHPIQIDDYNSLIAVLKSKRYRNVDCHAGISHFAITPDGECYPCHILITNPDEVIPLSILNNQESFYKQINTTYNKFNRNQFKTCENCWCRDVCVQCRYAKRNEGFCAYKRFTTEYLLNHIAKKGR